MTENDVETAPELTVAADMARKAIVVAVVLVILNFFAAAALIGWGAKRGGNHLMAAVLGGYMLRLGVLTAAIVLVKDASWVERAPLFITLLVTHIGLLIWETRSVSLSLAYPGLKPKENATR